MIEIKIYVVYWILFVKQGLKYYFQIISSENKSIITYEFNQKNIKLKDYSQLRPIFNLTYNTPVVKEIKTYLIEVDDK